MSTMAAEPLLAYMRVPVALHGAVAEVVRQTDRWCAELLDREYAMLCRRLTGMLARKRPSPLGRSPLDAGGAPCAAGILWTVGANNLLFDPHSSPHVTPETLASVTGVPSSTMEARAALIAGALDLVPQQVDLFRRSVLEHHPSAWLVPVDGALVDVRALPPAVRAEARRLGLVPAV